MAKLDGAVPQVVGREQLTDVRLQAGGVHWEGARLVTHLSTDTSKRSTLGQHIIVADELSLHPAGVMVRVGDDTFIVPHSRAELYRLK